MRINLSLAISFTACILIGCSDSDTIDTTITPETLEPVEGYLLEDDALHVVEVTNAFLPTPRLTPSVSVLVSGITQPTLIDFDLSIDRDNEVFLNDRSITAEHLLFLRADSPSKLYLTNLSSRREQVLFDLDNTTNAAGDLIFCEIKANQILDAEKLKEDKFERKQELRLLSVTAVDDCDDANQRNFFKLDIATNSDTNYSVIQSVQLEKDDPSIIEFELQNVSYSEFEAQRTNVDASFFGTSLIATNSQLQTYGYLNFSQDTNLSEDTWQFRPTIDTEDTNTFRLWQSSFNNVATEAYSPMLITPPSPSTDPSLLLVANRLLQIQESEIFDLSFEASRNQNLSDPVYTWSNNLEPTENRVNRLASGEIAIIDGAALMLVDNAGQSSQIRTLGSQNAVFTVSDTDILLTDTTNDQAFFSVVDRTGVASLIIGQVEQLQTYDFQNYFDYHNTSGGDDTRYAQSHTSGTVDFIPAIANSAWLQMKNYLEDQTQQLILNSDNTTGGIMRSPRIYDFDAIEPGGQGNYRGVINANIATIEEAAIINERFAMLWVKESFDENAPLQAYYFNPLDSEWVFTQVSSDTDFPEWLPFIEP